VKQRAAVIMLALAALPALPARADAPLDAVLAALVAESQAPAERIKLEIRRDARRDTYVIERVAPDRLHMVHGLAGTEQELIVIGPLMYLRTAQAWRQIPNPGPPGLVPSIADLFRTGISKLTEIEPMDGQRRFTGGIAWQNGAAASAGRIDIVTDATSGLPREMRFEGTCAGKVCQFIQSFDYDPALRIDRPR
jgi:hypothetical protein